MQFVSHILKRVLTLCESNGDDHVVGTVGSGRHQRGTALHFLALGLDNDHRSSKTEVETSNGTAINRVEVDLLTSTTMRQPVPQRARRARQARRPFA
jgi:hypothetical protein